MTRDQFRAVFNVVLALMLSGGVLFSTLAASSPALHQLIHDDAAASDHKCLITLFAAGQINHAAVEIAAAAILWICFTYLFPVLSECFPSVIFNFSSSRAPPAVVCL